MWSKFHKHGDWEGKVTSAKIASGVRLKTPQFQGSDDKPEKWYPIGGSF